MTRRVIKPQPDCPYVGFDNWCDSPRNAERLGKIRKTPCVPGDILWVRETWSPVQVLPKRYLYKADAENGGEGDGLPIRWRPSIHMPREAARIFLRVKNVRVERVQGITHAGALAEGIPQCPGWKYELSECDCTVYAFAELWNSLNAKRGYGWDTNPWVWVYGFERVDKPNGWPSGEGER